MGVQSDQSTPQQRAPSASRATGSKRKFDDVTPEVPSPHQFQPASIYVHDAHYGVLNSRSHALDNGYAATPKALSGLPRTTSSLSPTASSFTPRRLFPASFSADSPSPAKKSKTGKPTRPDVNAAATGEKRLRRFRTEPPQSFDDVYQRALSQRFYVLKRTRLDTGDGPEERIELTGSTGNVYTVCISNQPSCDCPHAKKGSQCKHQLYVLSRVLRAKFEYVYQLALLNSELLEIFANAPAPTDSASAAGESTQHDRHRKPVDGDCPICFNELEEGGEAIVWCRAACGQNIHKGCFEMWAATKRQGGFGSKADVTCPYCRSVWQGDDDMVQKIKTTGKLNHEGYVNVADQLGISTYRDTSSYSEWGRRRGQYY